MLYDILPPLETMERIPLSDLPDILDELSARIDKEDIGFVLTADGKDKYVLCPFRWFDDSDVVEIQIDSELLDRLKEIISPMGLTPEDLVRQFFHWCADPATTDQAVAWLTAHKNDALQ